MTYQVKKSDIGHTLLKQQYKENRQATYAVLSKNAAEKKKEWKTKIIKATAKRHALTANGKNYKGSC